MLPRLFLVAGTEPLGAGETKLVPVRIATKSLNLTVFSLENAEVVAWMRILTDRELGSFSATVPECAFVMPLEDSTTLREAYVQARALAADWVQLGHIVAELGNAHAAVQSIRVGIGPFRHASYAARIGRLKRSIGHFEAIIQGARRHDHRRFHRVCDNCEAIAADIMGSAAELDGLLHSRSILLDVVYFLVGLVIGALLGWLLPLAIPTGPPEAVPATEQGNFFDSDILMQGGRQPLHNTEFALAQELHTRTPWQIRDQLRSDPELPSHPLGEELRLFSSSPR